MTVVSAYFFATESSLFLLLCSSLEFNSLAVNPKDLDPKKKDKEQLALIDAYVSARGGTYAVVLSFL